MHKKKSQTVVDRENRFLRAFGALCSPFEPFTQNIKVLNKVNLQTHCTGRSGHLARHKEFSVPCKLTAGPALLVLNATATQAIRIS